MLGKFHVELDQKIAERLEGRGGGKEGNFAYLVQPSLLIVVEELYFLLQRVWGEDNATEYFVDPLQDVRGVHGALAQVVSPGVHGALAQVR